MQKSFLFFNTEHVVCLGKKKGKKENSVQYATLYVKINNYFQRCLFVCFFKSCFALWFVQKTPTVTHAILSANHMQNTSQSQDHPRFLACGPACCTPSTLWSLGLEWTVLITSVLIWRYSIVKCFVILVRVKHLMRNKMKAQTLARLNHPLTSQNLTEGLYEHVTLTWRKAHVPHSLGQA